MLTTGIHETIQSLTSISDSMPGLCSDMNKSAQKADTKYKASCFAKDIMGYKWSNGHASSTGNVLPVWNQMQSLIRLGMVKGSSGILERKMAPFLDDVDHVPDLDTQVHRDIFVIEKIFSIHSLRNLPSGFQCQVFRGKGAYGKSD